MRQGVMDFGTGCFAAIRNPVGHLPNEEVELTQQTALVRLATLSLLPDGLTKPPSSLADDRPVLAAL
jgi:hypothetical protein